jgi:hypothetical protein
MPKYRFEIDMEFPEAMVAGQLQQIAVALDDALLENWAIATGGLNWSEPMIPSRLIVRDFKEA